MRPFACNGASMSLMWRSFCSSLRNRNAMIRVPARAVHETGGGRASPRRFSSVNTCSGRWQYSRAPERSKRTRVMNSDAWCHHASDVTTRPPAAAIPSCQSVLGREARLFENVLQLATKCTILRSLAILECHRLLRRCQSCPSTVLVNASCGVPVSQPAETARSAASHQA